MAPLPSPHSRTVDAIYEWHRSRRSPYRSAGLAVSELGTECDRALWYRLRWADANEPVEGRKARLFMTGEMEEARLIDELRAIGVEVFDRDETGRQFALRCADEHVRGKADGVVTKLQEAPATPHLLEIKSHSAKNFKALAKSGLAAAYPKHYAQCQMGMHALGLTRAFYIATCKDTDELYAQRIEYDAEFCLRLEARARRIVYSDRPPARLHEDPKSKAAFGCGFCPSRGTCHGGELPPRNCRTCLSVEPRPGAIWHCVERGIDLTLEEQATGCGLHLYLPDLVPGEQIDADEAGRTVTYRMSAGEEWVDGRR